MQARYYDPVIGRFYSNDPVGFRDVHSFNRYAYANNNPYKYIDPDGRMPESLREWGNLAIGIGKGAESALQVVGGSAAIIAGGLDIALGSKIIGTALVGGGLYAIHDSKYTAQNAANTISDAWNNKTGETKHNVPEGPLQSTAKDLGCSADCQKVAGTVDKGLGMVTGNVSGVLTKGNPLADTLSSTSQAGNMIEIPTKVMNKEHEERGSQ